MHDTRTPLYSYESSMYLYPYLHSDGEDAVRTRRVLVERMLGYRPVSFSLDNVYVHRKTVNTHWRRMVLVTSKSMFRASSSLVACLHVKPFTYTPLLSSCPSSIKTTKGAISMCGPISVCLMKTSSSVVK